MSYLDDIENSLLKALLDQADQQGGLSVAEISTQIDKFMGTANNFYRVGLDGKAQKTGTLALYNDNLPKVGGLDATIKAGFLAKDMSLRNPLREGGCSSFATFLRRSWHKAQFDIVCKNKDRCKNTGTHECVRNIRIPARVMLQRLKLIFLANSLLEKVIELLQIRKDKKCLFQKMAFVSIDFQLLKLE